MMLEDCGVVVSALREQAMLTQAELAELMLRDVTELAAIEDGTLPLNESDLRALARVFGLNESRLLELAEPTRELAREAA